MQATRIDIKKGLDIPLAGAPEQVIHDAPPVSSVGVLGTAYIGLKPSMMVEVGDRVKLGQPLMEAKNNPGVLFTAPAAGRVTAINRGARRSLQSIAIEIDGDEEIQFESYPREKLGELSDQQVRDNLARSGLWTALRSRPYSKIPMLDSTPAAIFITAIDTRPHAPDPAVALTGHEQDFIDGLTV
ncbi:MAG: NADH:ubiquinone reductase (Na(+)-transporting) subunit A, partial [Panacagrimonas sp.]